ncbi:uncharacterized protein MONBRDRAFT_10174 [Monosiga brevicollis MX1]|uniref:CCHC-type domain-containing protein n=1 Tax=Monosiga brevicollis TaxID=81824 RepID=A9V5F3_MONBE|nr:uncharacterized protein MONBRDRAFT_10174 [Monosiga brevicollis MX1]EDQ87272.1 predicted protein [Monosiga brevicollis MX1]|eukprot:XP_001747885.1 hypothetical protein [Monosiga brevicollis MX1]
MATRAGGSPAAESVTHADDGEPEFGEASFCLDTAGMTATPGPASLEVPLYREDYDDPLSNLGPETEGEGESVLMESLCFNCEQPGHSARECPEPFNRAAFHANLAEFRRQQDERADAAGLTGGRFYRSDTAGQDPQAVSWRQAMRPGQISEGLSRALGPVEGGMPVDLLRRLLLVGYPPDWTPREYHHWCHPELEAQAAVDAEKDLIIHDEDMELETPPQSGDEDEGPPTNMTQPVKFPGFNAPWNCHLSNTTPSPQV